MSPPKMVHPELPHPVKTQFLEMESHEPKSRGGRGSKGFPRRQPSGSKFRVQDSRIKIAREHMICPAPGHGGVWSPTAARALLPAPKLSPPGENWSQGWKPF